jgi:energy-coupling factor transporter ATP-binding protein EcfA2
MLDLVHRAPAPSSSTPGLRVASLSYENDDVLLDQLDLEVGDREMVAIIADDDEVRGVLIDVLRGIVVPHAGTITIDGVELGDLANRARPPVVGPDHAQPPVATLRSLLAEHPDAVELLGSGDDLSSESDDPVRLRRLALAAAVAHNPDLLILDEPTDDIDGADERQLIRAVEAACYGRASVVFTHRLSLARKANSVLVLENGRLEPYRGHGTDNHAELWDARIPPVIEPDLSLRVVQADETRPATPNRPDTALTVGHLVADRFRLTGLLGRTAFTETWTAADGETGAVVRLKLPRLTTSTTGTDSHEQQRPVDYHAWEQLRREHDVVRSLRHPGVSQVLAADFDRDVPYVAFDYLDSPSLADALEAQPDGLDLLDVLHLGFEVAEILHHLHRRDQVHLNLRSGHIRSRGQSAVLTDFTQCRTTGTPLPPPHQPAPSPRPGSGPGSLRPLRHYAPELAPGRAADPAMDIYALGVLLRKAACGPDTTALLPFGELCAGAPGPVAKLLDRMTAIEPGERPDGAAIMTELRRALPAPVALTRFSTPPPRAPQLRLVTAASVPEPAPLSAARS